MTQSLQQGAENHRLRLADTARSQRQLFMRVTLGIVLVTGLINAALYFGIDKVIRGQFDALHHERLDRIAEQVDRSIQQQRDYLANLSGLLALDNDLANGTYYHLFLEGERHHPATAIARQSGLFDLSRISLWAASDLDLIAANNASPLEPLVPRISESPITTTRVESIGEEIWLVAQAPLEHNSVTIAWLVIAQPLSDVLPALEATFSADIRQRREEQTTSAYRLVRLETDSPNADLALEISAPDTVSRALTEVKRLLTAALAVAAIVLAISLTFLLRAQLRPIHALIEHLGGIAQGHFGAQAPVPKGPDAFARLVQAFNAMSTSLAHIRDMERRLQHQDKLSSIGRMAARVAHDINNPLTVINSAATALERGSKLSVEQQDLIAMMKHHARRCSQTVQELLNYGRPLTPRFQTIDLDSWVAELLERRRDRQRLAIRCTPEIKPPASTIECDPILIEQMLDNLINNAIEASPNSGVVEIVVENAEKDVKITVVDQGPGFSDEAREHLFEPFFTTKRNGTGLGMASVLGVVRVHNGDISIAAAPGGRVTIRLPKSQRLTGSTP